MSESRFQVGDVVYLHSGVNRGKLASVLSVAEDGREMSVLVERLGSESAQKAISEDACLIDPPRRPLSGDFLVAVEQDVRMRFRWRHEYWWTKKFVENPESDPKAITAEFAQFVQGLEGEQTAEVKRRRQELLSQLEAVPPHRQGAWWQEHWKPFDATNLSEYQQIRTEFLDADIKEQVRREMLEKDARFQEMAKSDPEKFEQELLSKVDWRVMMLVDQARDFRERCEAVDQPPSPPKIFAYLSVPQREVNLAEPRGLHAEDCRLLRRYHSPNYEPPPPSMKLLRESMPVPSLTEGEALSALNTLGAEARDALRHFICAPKAQTAGVLAARHQELKDQVDFNKPGYSELLALKNDIEIALVAIGKGEAAIKWLEEELGSNLYHHPEPLEWLGFCFGETNILPFADNPWGIPPVAATAEVLTSVWSPLQSHAPRFYRLLSNRVLATGVIKNNDGSPMLVCLTVNPIGEPKEMESLGLEYGYPTEFHAAQLQEWLGRGTFQVFFGGSPSDVTSARLHTGASYQLPLSLRELARVHGTMYSSSFNFSCELQSLHARLTDWKLLPEGSDTFAAGADGAKAEQFAILGSDHFANWEVMDLDQLDGRGDPVVRHWSREWEMGHGLSFWDWFEHEVANAFLSVHDYPLPEAFEEKKERIAPGMRVLIIDGACRGEEGVVVSTDWFNAKLLLQTSNEATVAEFSQTDLVEIPQ